MIYKYKTEQRSPKDFRNYQNPIDLFKLKWDGSIDPKEILKNQINFKSDLGEIIKGNPKTKSEDQISVIKNVENFFDFREEIVDFLWDNCFLLSEAKCKAKYRKGHKILTSKQMPQRLPIAISKAKTANPSENLLKKIRQTRYSL